jgi:outer membrane protein assembly factor BamB
MPPHLDPTPAVISRLRPSLLWLVLALSLSPCAAHGENWPAWRGPRGDGTSLDQTVPLEWDGATGKNVLWKTPLPGEGHGSPIVWEDRLFLVACLPETKERVLLCVDTTDGRVLWQRSVVVAPLEKKHTLNSYASTTPATDGELVYATFLDADPAAFPSDGSPPKSRTPGQIVVAAYDFEGQQRWLVRPGEFASTHGFCSNPVLFEDLVIVNGDHDGDAYVVALDRNTGETRWKTSRPHQTRSYVTPIIRELAGRMQLVLSGSKSIVSLDPRDGSRLWNVEGPTEQFVASMVDDGEQLYMAAGFPTHHVMAVRPDGTGDVTDTHVAWHITTAKCYVPSPVVIGRHLFVADDRGTANSFDTQTGERHWQDRLGNHFSASLTVLRGMALFLADDGTATFVRPGPQLDVVAQNSLGEFIYASPAIADGRMYLRGERHLFAIGASSSPAAGTSPGR